MKINAAFIHDVFTQERSKIYSFEKKKNILKVMTFTCNKKAKLFEFF